MPPDQPTPYLRASDADREAAAERLRVASVEGRLESEELEQRLAAVYAARWVTELERLTTDITPPPAPPPPPPVPYGYGPPVAYATPAPATNGMAVASLVSGFFWFGWLGSIVAVIFGHVALNQISRSQGRESGRGMAIAGLVLGYIGISTLILTIIVVAASTP
jgi:hypothetical protein